MNDGRVIVVVAILKQDVPAYWQEISETSIQEHSRFAVVAIYEYQIKRLFPPLNQFMAIGLNDFTAVTTI